MSRSGSIGPEHRKPFVLRLLGTNSQPQTRADAREHAPVVVDALAALGSESRTHIVETELWGA